jgi:hypothetical protein
MKKPRLNLAIKVISIALIIFLALIFIIGYIWKALETSDYFKIKDILSKEGNIPELSYLKGKNIFSVNLRNESRYILEYYPNYRGIKLVRLLPDRIFVDFIKRKPIAFVKLYRYFTVDEDGVLFYTPDQPQDSKLPIILGLETKIFGPKPGKSYNTRELRLALNIIREFRRNRALKNYKINKIDVANSVNASVIMGKELEGAEVRLGADNIKYKIGILSGLIIQEKFDLGNIKYIDLRFKEPVIKLKNVK